LDPRGFPHGINIFLEKGIVSGSFAYKIQSFKDMCRNEQQNVVLVTSIKKKEYFVNFGPFDIQYYFS
jgi:hypothetical protein